MHVINTASHHHLFLDNVRLWEVSPFLQNEKKRIRNLGYFWDIANIMIYKKMSYKKNHQVP